MADFDKMSTDDLIASHQKLGNVDKMSTDELIAAHQESAAPAPEYIKPLRNYPLEALGYVMSPLAKAAGWINDKFIDPYTGAPLRAMVGEAQKANSSLKSIAKTGLDQFGADPSKAPTNAQLAEKAGLPNRNIEIFPWEKTLYAPADRTTINPAEIGGQVIGLGTQPLTIVTTAYAPEISKGASAAYQKGSKIIGKLAADHLPENMMIPGTAIGAKLGGPPGAAVGAFMGKQIPTAPIIEGASKVGNAIGDALEVMARRLNGIPAEDISPIPNFPTKTQLKSSLGGK